MKKLITCLLFLLLIPVAANAATPITDGQFAALGERAQQGNPHAMYELALIMSQPNPYINMSFAIGEQPHRPVVNSYILLKQLVENPNLDAEFKTRTEKSLANVQTMLTKDEITAADNYLRKLKSAKQTGRDTYFSPYED